MGARERGAKCRRACAERASERSNPPLGGLTAKTCTLVFCDCQYELGGPFSSRKRRNVAKRLAEMN